MVEAILRLAPNDFTRPEAAREARLYKPSANRVLAALERDGVIEVVGKRPIRYGVRAGISRLEILGLAEAALRLDRRSGGSRQAAKVLAVTMAERIESRKAATSTKAARPKASQRKPTHKTRSARGTDGIRELRGLGKEAWDGVDADAYVAELRKDWGGA
jgi:hypothetical protein